MTPVKALVAPLLAALSLSVTAGAPRAETPKERPPVVLAQESAPDTQAIVAALRLRDVFAVMEEEGIAYGDELESSMFPGMGGANWAAAVREIYAADRVLPAFEAALADALAESGADVAQAVAFFSADPGKKAVGLEVSARRALLDEGVEDAAKLRVQEMMASRDVRLDLVREFVTVNDLVERNVLGGLNGSLAFYQGLATSGAFGEGMTESQMLEDVWGQEPAIRADTEEWLYAMLTMAYAPLTDEELRTYTAFSESDAGQALNAALFKAFDIVFTDISRRLGVAAAAFVAGQDI